MKKVHQNCTPPNSQDYKPTPLITFYKEGHETTKYVVLSKTERIETETIVIEKINTVNPCGW